MQTTELKKWINYLIFLIFTTVLFFLNLLGFFSSLYSINMQIFYPTINKVKTASRSFIGGIESFWENRKLKRQNLELAKLLVDKEDEILGLKMALEQCKDLANQVKLISKKDLKKLHQGVVLNRYYKPNGMILADFGKFAMGQDLKGAIVFYKHFWIGEVVGQQKNLLIIKTLWNSNLHIKVFLEKAKAVGLLVYENNEFKIKDILVKEGVKVGDIAYLPGNACVEKLVIGKITDKKSFLGSPKEILNLQPIMNLNELNYVYICK